MRELVAVLIWQAVLTDATDVLWDCYQHPTCTSSPAAIHTVSNENGVLCSFIYLFIFFMYPPRCST